MNKIKSFIETEAKIATKEQAIEISKLILDRIELTIDKIPDDFNYPIGKFRIVKVRRNYKKSGPVDLIEVNPIWCNITMGYSGPDAGWIEGKGSSTINVPPPEVLEEFWAELNAHLAE